jgi:hypothetical protein
MDCTSQNALTLALSRRERGLFELRERRLFRIGSWSKS